MSRVDCTRRHVHVERKCGIDDIGRVQTAATADFFEKIPDY
jgi:hypothetical protein